MPAGRRAKILLLAVLALIVLFAAFLLEERVRGQLGLRHYVRSLAASGIKVSPADFVSHDPPEQNGADELWAAAKQFKKGGVLPDSRPPAMKLTSSGDAVVVFREADWVEDKATQHWAQVAIDLQTNTAQLDAVCRALSKPVLNNHLDFNKAPNFDFQPLSQAMQLTKWLGPAALSCLHEGKTSEAVKYLIAETRLPRSLAEDRILISELVRIAIAAVARGDTWEALQAGGFTDQDLSNLQAAWEQLTFATNMSESLQGEVVFGLKTTDEMRKSLKFTRGCLAQYAEEGGGEGDHNSVGLWLWRFAWLDQSEIDYLRADKEFIDLFHAAAAQKSLRTAQEETQRMLARHENRNFWDNLRYPFRQLVGIDARCVPRVFRAETERSTVLAAIA
ncbi:MAG TPA: hypothetical protein VHH88_06235, partial [Verrucomicrobiae bacterium]|nr:hypothetical protein [Verrucomicrobiae bacterium]